MAGKPKIATLNLRYICLAPLCVAVMAAYLGWATLLIVCVAVFALTAVVAVRYTIGAIGIDSRTLTTNHFQYTLLFKLADSLPDSDKPNVRVFTFGLFLLANNGKMKAGFLKRNQLLARI